MSEPDDHQVRVAAAGSASPTPEPRSLAGALPERHGAARALTRLYIVHTRPIVTESLRIALDQETDIAIVGTQVETDLLEERVLRSQATVLLIDGAIDMNRIMRMLRAIGSTVRVIVMGDSVESDALLPCVTAGAMGVLSGPQSVSEIAAAIRRVREGWVVLTPEQLTTLMLRSRARTVARDVADLCSGLSERERDVLKVLAMCDSVDGTAEQLQISTHTVQTHLKNVMRKLHVRTRLAAVVIAFRAGIIE
ncbi:MAG: LuxR C-terminal-related transcriptional regulator [Chloroflexota bacterium]